MPKLMDYLIYLYLYKLYFDIETDAAVEDVCFKRQTLEMQTGSPVGLGVCDTYSSLF